jgi:hypothetical protein
MQAFLGTIIFLIICFVALAVAIAKSADYEGTTKIVMVPAWWAGCVAAFYVGATVVACILWVVAWIGIYLRYIALWIINMVLYPWSWIF